MEFTKQDLIQCSNLIKALKKGSFTLEGLEVIALSQAMSWLSKLESVIAAASEPKPEAPMTAREVTSPVTPAPTKTSRAPKKGV